jgi:hypothetical protein
MLIEKYMRQQQQKCTYPFAQRRVKRERSLMHQQMQRYPGRLLTRRPQPALGGHPMYYHPQVRQGGYTCPRGRPVEEASQKRQTEREGNTIVLRGGEERGQKTYSEEGVVVVGSVPCRVSSMLHVGGR